MKSKVVSLVLILLIVLAMIWIVGPTVSLAHQGASNPASQGESLHAVLLARATPTSSHSGTPTPLPAAYQVEQKHPAMIAGAGVLVLIILAGVLAFSRHKA